MRAIKIFFLSFVFLSMQLIVAVNGNFSNFVVLKFRNFDFTNNNGEFFLEKFRHTRLIFRERL